MSSNTTPAAAVQALWDRLDHQAQSRTSPENVADVLASLSVQPVPDATQQAPQVVQPPCGSYECRAAQRDGVLCADGECDVAAGHRLAVAPFKPEPSDAELRAICVELVRFYREHNGILTVHVEQLETVLKQQERR